MVRRRDPKQRFLGKTGPVSSCGIAGLSPTLRAHSHEESVKPQKRVRMNMKPGFSYVDDQLCADGVSLTDIAAEFGTPTFVYSGGLLRANYQRIAKAFSNLDATIAYSVKSNSNLAVLDLLRKEGAAFDIVSGGELARVLKVGAKGDEVIFAGVGKTAEEMRAAIKARVAEFNLESEPEAERLNAIAGEMGKRAPVAIRINPDIDAKTHKYITTGNKENKFGISLNRALKLAKQIQTELTNLDLIGLHCHIGSQILDPSVHARVVDVVIEFTEKLIAESGAKLQTLNFGGGFGIAYQPDQKALDPKPFAKALEKPMKRLGLRLVLEPGRSIAGPAGILLTKVEYIKHGDVRTFVIIDAAMTELIRPTLYEAFHEIQPVARKRGKKGKIDFVGPVCETGDFLALDREAALPAPGELLAIRDAGAYGFVMASHYNTRPNAAEVVVDGGKAHLARKRETYSDLMRGEQVVTG